MADEQGMTEIHQVHTQAGSYNGNAGLLGEFMQQVHCARKPDARAGQYAGPFAFKQRVGYGFHGARRKFALNLLCGGRRKAFICGWVESHILHIYRAFQVNRPHSAGLGHVYALLYLIADFGELIEHHGVLGKVLKDRQVIEPLQRELADPFYLSQGGLGLTGNDQAWGRIHIGADCAGNGVERPGAGGHIRHSQLPRIACISLGGHCGGLFMVAADVL